MRLNDRILITGGTGLVGTALQEKLVAEGYENVYTLSSKECDLTNLEKTVTFFELVKPNYVYHLAAAVYGIMGNMSNKAMVFLRNILINTHVLEASRLAGIKKVVAMGSASSYPYPPPELPLSEKIFWMGEPHHSENSYGHAKRSMLAQLNAYQESYGMEFAFVISTNLYGPNDKFDSEFGHVIPSLIRKFYEAKMKGSNVNIWGDGSACRDFLYASDAAEALMLIMKRISGVVNMASGTVSSIKEVVDHLSTHVGMKNHVVWDPSKPNGQEYRSFDLSRLATVGFVPKISLKKGLSQAYMWYENNVHLARK
jgi:GDP-L-fucose synthase